MTSTDNCAGIICSVPETSRLVTTKQAADALNITTRTLHRWHGAGIVEPASQTAGGHFRWDIEQLRAQVQHHLNTREHPETD